MPPKTEAKTTGVPVVASMSYKDFTAAKKSRNIKTKYGDFIAAMKPETVYDASATFPGKTNETLRSALSNRASKMGVTLSTVTRDGTLYVSLADKTKSAA